MNESSLDITTSGQFEVRLFDETGELVRRRHVDDPRVASSMIRDWHDFNDQLAWDHLWDWTAVWPYNR